MWELTEDNALAYLRASAVDGARPRVRPLSGGVSNVVLRVEQGEDASC
ncbi:MAG: hypothetical protein U0797_12400 [Gemmataceae bacterium]